MLDSEHLSRHSTVDVDAALDILDEIETLGRHGHRHLNLQMALENILLQVRSLGLTDKPASTRSLSK
jgi:hypothetical protein